MTEFEELKNLPTLMDIEQEIDVMSTLMGMTVEHIESNVEAFRHVINHLANSHQLSGYMEVRPGNQEELIRFSNWLEPLLSRLAMDTSMMGTFRFTYEDLLNTYPQLRRIDTEDSPSSTHSATGSGHPRSPKELHMLRDMPLEMNTTAELAAMKILQAIPLKQLIAHRDEITEIVQRLERSHGSPKGGLFGLTPHNEGAFHDFADWLRGLGPLMGWPATKRWSFDVTFAQASRIHPHLRDEAAAGPQPGSPVVVQLGERVKQTGPLEILGSGAAWRGISLVGQGWAFSAGRGWRVLNPDRTLAYSWMTPDVDSYVTDLVGLYVAAVTPQSCTTTTDPVIYLSDGRSLEVFTGDPLTPWIMRLPNGTFAGAPTEAAPLPGNE